MAYVTHLKPDGTYQPLKAHEENVAALAGKFAEAFGAKAHGERTGLLHDIGKLVKTGGKPIFMGFCCWVAIACVSLLVQHLLGIW